MNLLNPFLSNPPSNESIYPAPPQHPDTTIKWYYEFLKQKQKIYKIGEFEFKIYKRVTIYNPHSLIVVPSTLGYSYYFIAARTPPHHEWKKTNHETDEPLTKRRVYRHAGTKRKDVQIKRKWDKEK